MRAVGIFKPRGPAIRATYVGKCYPKLVGQVALVSLCDHNLFRDCLVAQFTDRATGFGFGWHLFNPGDFVCR